jgi:hypothetical protein
MTETQAKSGAAGTSTNPAEADGSAEATQAASRTVGRATVPADAPSGTDQATGQDGAASKGPGAPEKAAGGSGPSAGRPEGSAPGGATATRPGNAAGGRESDPGPRTGNPGRTTSRPGSARPATGRATPSVPPSATRTAAIRPTGLNPAAGGMAGAAAVGAAKVGDAVRAARVAVSGAASRGPRRARLFVKRVDPWSVMKFSFAVSLVLFIVGIIATSVLYFALDAMGVFDSINKALADMVGAAGSAKAAGIKITAKGVIGISALLGGVNVVLFTALATLGAFVYNVCSDLVGGIEVTHSEKQ